MATAVTISRPAAAPQPTPALTRPALLRRVFERLMQARQRQADREIAEILRRRGGVIADDPGLPLPSRLERLYRPAG